MGGPPADARHARPQTRRRGQPGTTFLAGSPVAPSTASGCVPAAAIGLARILSGAPQSFLQINDGRHGRWIDEGHVLAGLEAGRSGKERPPLASG